MEDHPIAPPALQTLQRSADELTAMFESDAIGMAIVVEGRFTRCNRKYENFYGCAPGALIGKSTRVVFPSEEEFARQIAQITEVLARGATFRQDYLTTRGDGSAMWLRITGTALDATKIAAGSVWLVDDITQTREHEE